MTHSHSINDPVIMALVRTMHDATCGDFCDPQTYGAEVRRAEALVKAGLVRTTPTPGLLEEFSNLVQEWVRSATRAQSYAGARDGLSDHKELLAYARGLDRCAAALMTAIKKGQAHE